MHIMSIINSIKRSPLLRGFGVLITEYFGVSRRKFGYIAEDVVITPPLSISNPQNVYLYGNNGLNHATLLTTNAKFIMKKNSGAAYGLKVSTRNHARIIGIPYRCISESNKPSGLDHDVIVEEDVWIGMNVTLLSGVTLRRGTTVAAGAVVNRSTPPYSIVGGVPAKFIKFYWTIDQILEHEAQLYPENERFTKNQLEEYYKEYNAIKD